MLLLLVADTWCPCLWLLTLVRLLLFFDTLLCCFPFVEHVAFAARVNLSTVERMPPYYTTSFFIVELSRPVSDTLLVIPGRLLTRSSSS